MNSLSKIYRIICERLKSVANGSAAQESRWILKEVLNIQWADIIDGDDVEVTLGDYKKIEAILEKRLQGVPLSRIFAKRQFFGRDFKISEHTLDPRADTEILVDLVRRQENPRNILDLGTGSGCVLLSLLLELPGAAGVGVDISPWALKTAQENACRHEVSKRAVFLCGSWLDALKGSFDLVVSNPPYIENQELQTLDDAVKKFDPLQALDGGKDGLQAYKYIFAQMAGPDFSFRKAYFEIGYNQGEAIKRLAEDTGFSVIDVHADLAGRARVVEISCGDK